MASVILKKALEIQFCKNNHLRLRFGKYLNRRTLNYLHWITIIWREEKRKKLYPGLRKIKIAYKTDKEKEIK